MANVISNYFSIKKNGSIPGPLKTKKNHTSAIRLRKASSVSSVQDGDDVCIASEKVPTIRSSSQKIRTASLSSNGDNSNAIVDTGCLPPVVKSIGKERANVEFENTNSPRKRKISYDSQEVKDANPPKKLIKLTAAAIPTESTPQPTSSNGKVHGSGTAQQKPTEKAAFRTVKISKPVQLKKNLSIRKASAKPVLQKEKLTTLFSKVSSVSSKTENSEEVATQKDSKNFADHQYLDLASKDVASSPTLLPLKFKFLAEGFRCLDTVISIMHNRQEMCPFAKIKSAVEDMMRRKFGLRHLGQIKTVFPAAYHFQLEKLHINRNSSTESQLTISPNIDCFSTDELPNGILDESSLPNASKSQQFEKMKPSFLLARLNIFRLRLKKIVEQHHKEFLTTLNPPIVLDVDQIITHWHPKFLVDSVPDIVPSELPKPAETNLCVSAMDVLHKIKSLYSKKTGDATELVSSKCAPVPIVTNITQPKTLPQSVPSAIKGIPLALLEKIRAREAAKIKADMTRNPDADLRLQMMSRLPDLARILRNLFISEKKAALPFSDASIKLSESYVGSVNPMDMEKHLYLIKELVPDWLIIVNIRTDVYLKTNKAMNFSDVLSKIENARKVAAIT